MVPFKKLKKLKYDNDEQCIVILLNYVKKTFPKSSF